MSTTGSLSVAELTKGTPFPGTFVVDREGRVTSRYFEEFYRERSTASSIMLRLGEGAQPITAARISTGHLDVTTYPSDSTVAPGSRFALVVSVVPRPGIHVYAPGATGYRVVSLHIARQPFVRSLAIRYPSSEIYFFKPLNERVPVYQKAFTLVQDIVVEVTPDAERALRARKTLTLTGALEYQACDGVPFKFFTSNDSVERPVAGFNADLSPILGNPVLVTGNRLVDGRGSYGVGLSTFAFGFPAHFDWSWRTLMNRRWEDVVFAQQGGSDAFRRVKFSLWIGYDF